MPTACVLGIRALDKPPLPPAYALCDSPPSQKIYPVHSKQTFNPATSVKDGFVAGCDNNAMAYTNT